VSKVFADKVLAGKVAFVTGGTSGINLGIALRFAEHGAKVAVLGRNEEKAKAAEAQLKALGAEALAVTADVRQYALLEEAIKKAVDAFGPIDVLVNGAAGNFPAPAAGLSANGFKAVVDIDLLGTFNACRAAFEHLRKPGASIINISAPQSYMAAPLQSHVCAAKAGCDMVMRVLAMEWGPVGVRVNAISPGPVEGTEGMARLAPDAATKERVQNAVPLRRFADRGEIADLALFLASPAASYMTGALIPCDGGQALGGFGAMFPM